MLTFSDFSHHFNVLCSCCSAIICISPTVSFPGPALQGAVQSHFGSQLPGCLHLDHGGRFHAHVTVAKPPKAENNDSGGSGGGFRGRGRRGSWHGGGRGGGGGGYVDPSAPLKAACAQLITPSNQEAEATTSAELMISCQVEVRATEGEEVSLITLLVITTGHTFHPCRCSSCTCVR